MNIFKFGTTPKKTFEITQDGFIDVTSIWYGGGSIEIEDIKAIFVKSPSNEDEGTVYISTDGSNPYENPVTDKNGFIFTKAQQSQVVRFIGMLTSENEEIAVHHGKEMKVVPREEDNPNIVVCPNCKSKNVEFLENTRKSFSAGKAVSGALLVGGVGAFAGFIGKKGKDRWHCEDCGTIFEK